MEYLDYYFERNDNYGSTEGVVNRKIKLINIFYPNLIRQNAVLISTSTPIIRQNNTGVAETRNLTWEERDYNLQEFVTHINNFITNNFQNNELRMEIVNDERVRWVSDTTDDNITWRILISDIARGSFFSPTGEIGQVLVQTGVTTADWIPDLKSGVSNLEIRFSDNNFLQVPWVGSYLSQTVYTFHTPIYLHLKNANRVEIRGTFGGSDTFGILNSPLRRVLRLGFVEEKE